MKRPLHKIGIPTLFVCIVLFSFCMKPINVSADYETPGNFSTTFPQSQKLFHVEGGSLLLSTDGANYTKAALLSDPENPQSALDVYKRQPPLYLYSGNHNSAGNAADKQYYSQVFSGQSCCRINGKTCSLGICSTRANSSYSKFSAS